MKHSTGRRTFLKRFGLAGLGLVAARGAAADEPVTPAQIEGPFYPVRHRAETDFDLTRVAGRTGSARGSVVALRIEVVDRKGRPVDGARIDVWQACWSGRYDHPRDRRNEPLDPNFQYEARLVTDAEGASRIRTIVPGAYPGRDGGMRPPHIHFRIDAFDERLTTQMYFAGQEANDGDSILGDARRRYGRRAAETLIVPFEAGADGVPAGTFRIVLGVTPPDED